MNNQTKPKESGIGRLVRTVGKCGSIGLGIASIAQENPNPLLIGISAATYIGIRLYERRFGDDDRKTITYYHNTNQS
ncbi:hypothetical protein ACFL96_18515 [Thermoproteota archaeon]